MMPRLFFRPPLGTILVLALATLLATLLFGARTVLAAVLYLLVLWWLVRALLRRRG